MGILGAIVFLHGLILPSIQSPLGALPSRFRRSRVLIVGCGDVGLRVAQLLAPRVRVLALTSSAPRMANLRTVGITPLLGNLDAVAQLRRLAGLAQRILYLAPPTPEGGSDGRLVAFAQATRLRAPSHALVYASTSGVYGDCQGAWVTESAAISPTTPRAQRRAHAEATVRFLGRSAGVKASVLRVPGIYANDRDGGTPLARLQKGSPVLHDDEDVYTNHIHADDLARACFLALWRGKSQRSYNINDDTDRKMGQYLDAAADLYGLPRPPRVAKKELQKEVSAMQLSFMNESRRLVNQRMKKELGLRLRYPSALDGLAGS
ncbi:MAG: NAD-dependent epimerase/dehydratase family protein [Sulfuritalea sp.]|nr:NAD-dependent epimerase/dehydratase family protein [Sulfuritalea sp.]